MIINNIVDDNPITCTVLAEMLKPYASQILTASSGQEAFALLQNKTVDLMLTDWKMPGMDGITLIKKILEYQLPKLPRMVLTTAYGYDEACRDLIGLDGILHKPVSRSTLHNTIVDLFSSNFITHAADYPIKTNQPDTGKELTYTVLLVDDNELNRQIGVDLFQKAGVLAETAINGKDALEKILQAEPNHYAAIFMDLEMPVMDGHSACKELRKDRRFDTIPVIALTAHAISEIREQCRDEGMQGFLTKPIHPEQLFSLLDSLVKSPSSHSMKSIQPAFNDIENSSHELKPNEADEIFVPETGLSYMNGNIELYISVLEKFCDAHSEDARDIKHLLETGNTRAAEIKAHTLKSLAASIGAQSLSVVASQIEKSIKINSEDCDLLLKKALLELPELIKTIKNFLITKQCTQPLTFSEPGSEETDAATVIARFQHLAEIMSGETIKYLNKYAALLQSVWGREKFQAVAACIAAYDFDEALRKAIGNF